MLTAADDLPHRPARVLVAGTSGSGKTTVAGAVAEELGIPHVEVDALFHGPAWVPQPSFVADVRRFAAEPAWVPEWQYGQVRELLATRADLVVWLDPPRAAVLGQGWPSGAPGSRSSGCGPAARRGPGSPGRCTGPRTGRADERPGCGGVGGL